MMLDKPQIKTVLVEEGDVSDELDYFVNTYIMNERGMGLTACQPSLVELMNGLKAIRFKLDSTFVDNESDNILGFGKIGSENGFVGEILISYNSSNPDEMDIIYLTSKEEIEENINELLSHPDSFQASPRPRGKY